VNVPSWAGLRADGSTAFDDPAGSATEAASVGDDEAATDDGVAGCEGLCCVASKAATEGCDGATACAPPSGARSPAAESCLQHSGASWYDEQMRPNRLSKLRQSLTEQPLIYWARVANCRQQCYSIVL